MLSLLLAFKSMEATCVCVTGKWCEKLSKGCSYAHMTRKSHRNIAVTQWQVDDDINLEEKPGLACLSESIPRAEIFETWESTEHTLHLSQTHFAAKPNFGTGVLSVKPGACCSWPWEVAQRRYPSLLQNG